MGRIKKGGYEFTTWIGDHDPRHVHVYRDGKMIVKWDLDNGKVMKGKINKKIKKLIKALQKEGGL
ncbi:DUF4160 domain-containing protein [bacterium AH-315-F18]|nr:DUF4160 domain-containing protein [bacterium AH-315-F18]